MPASDQHRDRSNLRVLFLCTGNSCRSQMAEGWTRHLHRDTITAYSAGTHPQRLDPRAVTVMAEAGIDISSHTAKTLADVRHLSFDYVVTVCSDAHETCPVFPGQTQVIHVGFDDPPRLAANANTPEEAWEPYRRVRDAMQAFIARLTEALTTDPKDAR